MGEEPEEPGYDDSDGIGCYQCDGGWHHGCMDDLCRGSYGADQCDDAIACRHCNPEGDFQ